MQRWICVYKLFASHFYHLVLREIQSPEMAKVQFWQGKSFSNRFVNSLLQEFKGETTLLNTSKLQTSCLRMTRSSNLFCSNLNRPPESKFRKKLTSMKRNPRSLLIRRSRRMIGTTKLFRSSNYITVWFPFVLVLLFPRRRLMKATWLLPYRDHPPYSCCLLSFESSIWLQSIPVL